MLWTRSRDCDRESGGVYHVAPRAGVRSPACRRRFGHNAETGRGLSVLVDKAETDPNDVRSVGFHHDRRPSAMQNLLRRNGARGQSQQAEYGTDLDLIERLKK